MKSEPALARRIEPNWTLVSASSEWHDLRIEPLIDHTDVTTRPRLASRRRSRRAGSTEPSEPSRYALTTLLLAGMPVERSL